MRPPYVVELLKTNLNVQLDNTEIMNRCADADGCTLVLGARSSMRGADWLPNFRAVASCRLHIETNPSGTTGIHWSLDDACANAMSVAGRGIDNDGVQQMVARIFGSTCVIADYPRIGDTFGPDDSVGFSLFYFDDTSNEDTKPDFTCVVSISD